MKWKRRWMLIAGVLIAAATLLAWSLGRVWTALEQERTLTGFVADGGQVTLDYQSAGTAAPRAPVWLRGIAGDWPLTRVVKATIATADQLHVASECERLTELDCSAAQNCEEQLKSICRCKHLRVLNLHGSRPSTHTAGSFIDISDCAELETLDLSGSPLIEGYDLACFKRMPQLRSLSLARTGVGDNDVRRLKYLAHLESLDLSDTRIGGPGLAVVARMKELRKLNLHGCSFFDLNYLAELKNLPHLEELDLSGTSVGNTAAAILAELKGLKRLDLSDTSVRGPGFKHLRGMELAPVRLTLRAAELEDESIDASVPIVGLNLSMYSLTDKGLQRLALFPQLEELDLSNTSFDDYHVRYLAGLTHLQKLNLSGTPITDSGLNWLARLTELRELTLKGTKVSGPGLAVLTNMPQLEALSLEELQISDEDAKHLVGLLRLKSLNVSGSPLTDAAIASLSSLKELRQLSISNTLITASGEQQLRKALPEVKIENDRNVVPGQGWGPGF